MIEIWIHLFGKPEWEMNLEEASAKEFEELGKNLYQRLKWVSELIPKLESKGWERSASLYDIFYCKDITLKEAKEEFKSLGIDENNLNIEELEYGD